MKSAAAAARPGDGSAVTAAAAGATRRSNQFTDDPIKKKVETTKKGGQIRKEGQRGSGITAPNKAGNRKQEQVGGGEEIRGEERRKNAGRVGLA